MNWMTLVLNALVPLASVISSATVAIWTKRIDARNKAEDRRHERVLDFEKRAADDKKAILKSLISATIYVKRAARFEGVGTAEEIASQRRAEATQLDSRKRELAQTTACPIPREDVTVFYEGELKWSELRKVETVWLERLGRESDLDLDALVNLCDRTLEAAHKDLRGGYGLE